MSSDEKNTEVSSVKVSKSVRGTTGNGFSGKVLTKSQTVGVIRDTDRKPIAESDRCTNSQGDHRSFLERFTLRNKKARKTDELDQVLTNTDFSEKEIKKWYKQFRKENPSGKIGAQEIKKLLSSRFREGDPDEAAERIVQIFDADKSGSLDFLELMTALSITKKGSKREKLKLAFDMVDTDQSGTIEKTEMLELMRILHDLVGITITRASTIEDNPASHADQLMREFDENNDNVITFDEFVEGVTKNPNLATLMTAFASPEMLCKDFTD